MSRQSNFSRKVKGLSQEQVEELLRKQAFEEEIAVWRQWGLKRWAEKKRHKDILGNFEPSGGVYSTKGNC